MEEEDEEEEEERERKPCDCFHRCFSPTLLTIAL